MHSNNAPSNSPEVLNFSLIHGGILHNVRIHLRMAARDRTFDWRHVIAAIALTWLPLLILSSLEGVALGNGIKMPFLLDYSTNIRLLVTLPLLIAAEYILDPHIREAVWHFLSARLVTDDRIPEFEKVIQSTMRLRDSWMATSVLFLIAYVPSIVNSGEMMLRVDTSSWHFVNSASGPRLGWTGLWFSFISIPVFRLIVFRWLWLAILWAVFLWRVTHLRLNGAASHPDRAGGLGFLTHTQLFFGIVTFAMSATTAGGLANQMAYDGATLQSLQYLMLGMCVLSIAFTVAPLIVVSPYLFRLKQRGIFEYSSLGVAYTEDFENKWILGRHGPEEPLLGSADIQSLADFGNSYDIIHEMKVFLIDHEILLKLAIPAVIPMLVLIATVIPAEEIFKAMLHLLE